MGRDSSKRKKHSHKFRYQHYSDHSCTRCRNDNYKHGCNCKQEEYIEPVCCPKIDSFGQYLYRVPKCHLRINKGYDVPGC